MSDYDNANKFSLWKNDKRTKQTQPHLSGQGETTSEVWVSAWFSKELSKEDGKLLQEIITRHRESSKQPFLSISIQEKNIDNHAEPAKNEGDDIPF